MLNISTSVARITMYFPYFSRMSITITWVMILDLGVFRSRRFTITRRVYLQANNIHIAKQNEDETHKSIRHTIGIGTLTKMHVELIEHFCQCAYPDFVSY